MMDHPNLADALVAALADLRVVEAARSATIPMKTGGSYAYKYADLGDVVKLTRPALADHGLVALTPVHSHGDELACTVILLHASGERLDLGPFPFPHGKDAQATGSMVTYHRRYALVAALGMAAGDDDDGASAAARTQAREPAEDPVVPGLRSSIEGAIAKLTDDQKAALKQWFADNQLPAVRRMNAAQCDVVIAHLMDGDQAATTQPVAAPATDPAPAGGNGAAAPPAATQGADIEAVIAHVQTLGHDELVGELETAGRSTNGNDATLKQRLAKLLFDDGWQPPAPEAEQAALV